MKVYDIVLEKVKTLVEKTGLMPWQRTWKNGSSPFNLISKQEYRGINVFLLSATQMAEGWEHPVYLSKKQAKDLGGSVKPESDGNPVFFYKKLGVTDDNGNPVLNDDGKQKVVWFERYFTVYNIAQCNGIEYKPKDDIPNVPIKKPEKVIKGYKDMPKVIDGKPSFVPAKDIIRCPPITRFKESEHYYATLFHEMVHSTGHETRLNRDMKNWFGSELYSKEELIAEFGASFLCAKCGIDSLVIENQAAYIKGWLSCLAEKPKQIMIAASQAEKAVRYITGEKAPVYKKREVSTTSRRKRSTQR